MLQDVKASSPAVLNGQNLVAKCDALQSHIREKIPEQNLKHAFFWDGVCEEIRDEAAVCSILSTETSGVGVSLSITCGG